MLVKAAHTILIQEVQLMTPPYVIPLVTLKYILGDN